MITKKKLLALNLINLYLVIGVLICILIPKDIDIVLKENYIIDTIAYFIMTGIFIFIFIKHKLDILDPIVFVSIIYIFMFSIVPIIDIMSGNVLILGVNLFEYGVKGTVIAILGYCSFCLGYLINIRYKQNNQEIITYDNYKIKKLSLSIWLISFFISVIYLILANGYSLSYILTLGLVGNVDRSNIKQNIDAISMLSYSLIPCCLIYTNYSKNKMLRWLIFIATLSIQFVSGFRFIVIILVLSHIYMYYLKHEKRPSIKIIICMFIIVIIFIGAMEFSRGAMRTGGDIIWSNFKWKNIQEAILGNFGIYKTYYAVLKSVPDKVPHLYGGQMIIYTLIMFIPRAIWPNKPSPAVNEPIVWGISEYASKAGQAYPGIGEYYYDFGILGVVFFMYIFGYCMMRLKRLYMKQTNNYLKIALYSIMVPTTLQLIIRGYTPSNFYLVIFLTLPIIIIKRLSIKR